MASNVQTIYSGPVTGIPMTFAFETKFDGDALLYFAVSAYASSPGMLVMNVDFDGVTVGNATAFTNEAESHKALVANIFPVSLPDSGTHKVMIYPNTGQTIVDSNDWVELVLIDIDDRENSFIWNTAGAVPAYTNFVSDLSGAANAFYSGSGFVSQAGTTTGLVLVLDHNPLASSQLCFNEPQSHKALPPQFVPMQLTPGHHQVGLSTTDGNLVSDGNDNFVIAIWW